VDKKQYTFQLIFPHNLAFIKYSGKKLKRTNRKVGFGAGNITGGGFSTDKAKIKQID
jgi:hypothetical protein